MFKKFQNINLKKIIIPALIFILLLALFVLVIDSLLVVSETSKNNFAYTVKVRDVIEEIDVIVERAEVNINVLADYIASSYDLSKADDESYNKNYIKNISSSTESILKNSPGADGVWFQINADLPFASNVYSWNGFRDGKIVDLSVNLSLRHLNDRKITLKDDPYYFQAIGAKEAVWSQIYRDKDLQIPMITISKSVYRNNALIGVVGIDISVMNLKQAMQRMQAAFDRSEIFLLDNHRTIIFSQLASDNINQKTDYGFLNLFVHDDSKKQTMVEYSDNGVNKTAIILCLSNKYDVVITFPTAVISNGVERLFGIIGFILIVVILLTLTGYYHRYKLLKINNKYKNEIVTVRNIISYAPTIICVKDINGICIECNENFAKMVGLKKEDVIGKLNSELFDEQTAEMLSRQDFMVIHTKRFYVDTSWITFANGEKKLLEKHRIPLLDEKNNSVGVFVNSIDVTKKYQEQEQLELAKENAEKIAAMKSNFLANMSHEIRTPMNGVLGFLQLLEDTNPTEEQREFIADAEKSSELLLLIINEILDFSKIEAGKLVTDNVSFDVRSIVEDVTIMNTSNAFKKGIDVNSLICSDVPQKVFGDPGRVKQILNNLVDNAIKFTKEGDVVIYVNQVSEDDDNAILSFRVKDVGIGIAEDKLKLIFDSFTQADVSATRKYGGTGLGLAISKKLAELMNGNIRVESQLNMGSTFTLNLPFKKDNTSTPKIDNSTKSLNGANILIVGRNSTDLNIIRYYLNEANCFSKKAYSPEEALYIINQDNQKISVILIDSEMQNTGGRELSHLIKSNEKSKDIPLILYTSLAKRGDAILAKEKGFTGYLTKPFKKHELVESIAIALNIQNANKQEYFITKHFLKENKFDAKIKILMVEDTELNCKFILKLLNRVGLTCDIANEGESAVEAIGKKNYDLILMDCQMPIMDGYKATQEIRKIQGESLHTPIIAMTANAMQSDKEKCYEAGMDDYICKPINAEELLSLMAKYIKVENSAIETSGVTSEMNNDSHIDKYIQKMVSEVGFTPDEALELFNEFLQFLPQCISDIESALENSEFENLKQIAHKLKGSSANLRIEEIAKLSAELENECLKEDKALCIDIIIQIKKHMESFNTLNVL